MIELARVDCPYCGESFDTTVDLSSGDQHYVEDCAVCCRPIRFIAQQDPETGDYAIEVSSEI